MGLELWVGLFAALVGAVLGSFLNVCIVRLPRGESVVAPRSHCRACGGGVRWFDNFPVLSYALLRGRCRGCGGRIGLQYPLVELGLAAWFAVCVVPAARLLAGPAVDVDRAGGALAHAAGLCVLGFLLLGLGVMDWQTGLLVNEFTLGGLAAGIFFAFLESFFVPSVRVKTFLTPEEVFIFRRVGAALLAGLGLWLVGAVYRLVRKRSGMGGGDVKMLAMVGAFLGLELTALTFLVATGVAALLGVVLLARRKADGQSPLPFGSALAVGGAVAALLGPALLGWYAGLLR